jgi:hypothetical protein
MPAAPPMPRRCRSLVRFQKLKKRVETKMFRPFFHVSSHAVVGRLACLTEVPALLIFNVTPLPE